MAYNKVLLCILDGFGMGPADNQNVVFKEAKKIYQMIEDFSFTMLDASEEHVGLPKGQMGNSEVGHMTIGLGRTLFQDLLKIEHALNEQIIQTHPNVLKMITDLKHSNKTCHIMGLLSPGGVHSHQNHILKIIDFLCQQDVSVCLHAILDGRDTPPESAFESLKTVTDSFSKYSNFKWGTIMGRYFAMDRDSRYDRTEKAYQAIVSKKGSSFRDPLLALQSSYEKGISDEFVEPFVFKEYQGIQDGDSLWMVNFRADRVRQILESLLCEDFSGFKRSDIKIIPHALGFYNYSSKLSLCKNYSALFKKDQNQNGLSDIVSQHHLKQLHIAETEKYAHVTFFFNGGREEPFEKEDRVLIDSPKVKTYDLCPQMSAEKIYDTLSEVIHKDTYHFIVVNFANPDMVGHTGKREAVSTAIKVIDAIVFNLANLCLEKNIKMILTADHGNAECLVDEKTNQPHTAHTLNKVPFVLIDHKKYVLNEDGTLRDIAPTILNLMRIDKPTEMTGQNLIQ
ncbi:MAG: 2,3-bisphosphoglycerate-independent phosphoglycerate mutase [Holosporales bacterium]